MGVYNVILVKGATPQDDRFAPVLSVLNDNKVELAPVRGLTGIFTLNANGAPIANEKASAIIGQMMTADTDRLIDGALLVTRQPAVA